MKKKDKVEVWDSTIGVLKKHPKSKVKWEFSGVDVLRWVISLIGFGVPFSYWSSLYTGNIIIGLIVGLFLFTLFEVSCHKRHDGILEVVSTGEILPSLKVGWENLNKVLWYLLVFLLISLFFIVPLWLGG